MNCMIFFCLINWFMKLFLVILEFVKLVFVSINVGRFLVVSFFNFCKVVVGGLVRNLYNFEFRGFVDNK